MYNFSHVIIKSKIIYKSYIVTYYFNISQEIKIFNFLSNLYEFYHVLFTCFYIIYLEFAYHNIQNF